MLQKKNIELDDFIIEELMEKQPRINPKVSSKIDPQAKLVNFSHIKVAAIDPRIKEDLSALLKNIKTNLERLKSITK
jgi:hypothetical protein